MVRMPTSDRSPPARARSRGRVMALSPPRNAFTGPAGSADASRSTPADIASASSPSTGKSPRSDTATARRSLPRSPSNTENPLRADRTSPGHRHASDATSDATEVGTPTTSRSGSAESDASQVSARGHSGSVVGIEREATEEAVSYEL